MLEARPPSVAAGPFPETPEAERPDELATGVAKAVRELRANAGLSERAAARLLGTSQTQLRRMEDPRYLPSLRSLARVATAYGHRLRIEFEPRVPPGGDRRPSKTAKTTARAKGTPARARSRAPTRPTRGRPRRRA